MAYTVRPKDDGLYSGVHRPKDQPFDLDQPEDFAPSWQIPIGWNPSATTESDKAAADQTKKKG
ncbi:hypothetical protein [Magnetospirillum molischianum]|uniref:Uncharacterized protein n=1 Tax=Magnetospirillum molischianum DSM 120 TaxID=1150626 RepID=H8FP69_MAGML|nr:hypothetical protein [Magnetospirillum molischianum]CCG40157.1 hypothetical protein PHAMO_180126 [Magnetospirillum molischianum DSM 120]